MNIRAWPRLRRKARLTWVSENHDDGHGGDIGDQFADLPWKPAPHAWAAVGPDGRPEFGAWSWTIEQMVDDYGDTITLDGGYAESEEAAKQAVVQWLRDNRRKEFPTS